VDDADIAALAHELGLTAAECEKQYVRGEGLARKLYEWPSGDCVFFDEKQRRCKVYEVRPKQCRNWPFWKLNLGNREAWQRAAAQCPGIGHGRWYDERQIARIAGLASGALPGEVPESTGSEP